MKLSTRGRYGLRAMLEIALGFEEGPVLTQTISEHQEISRKYLHTLLTTLKGAGLVRSVRGTGGGYVLTRSPSEIRVSEVVSVLEGSLIDCVGDKNICNRSAQCVTRELWQELSDTIEGFLSQVTLHDLVVRTRKKEASPQMFYI